MEAIVFSNGQNGFISQNVVPHIPNDIVLLVQFSPVIDWLVE